MTREEAIRIIKSKQEAYKGAFATKETHKVYCAYNMAIEALQSYCPPQIEENAKIVVQCKDCLYQEHCHKTVAHTKEHDGFREHWPETIEWCSRGERKEP